MAIRPRRFVFDWEAPPPGGNADGALSYRVENGEHAVLVAQTNVGVVNHPEDTSIYEWTINEWNTDWDRLNWVMYVTDGVDTEALVNSGGAPYSSLVTYQELLDRFGSRNVARASNKDNDNAVTNTFAIQQSMDYAESAINDYFRDSPYAVPFDFTPNGGSIPAVLKEWNLNLTYGHLYTARGMSDNNRVGSKVSRLITQTWQQMARYKGGLRRLNVALKTGQSLGPSAVTRRIIAELVGADGAYPDGVPTLRYYYA